MANAKKAAHDQPRMYIGRGRRKSEHGDFEGAIVEFTTALQMDPKNIRALGHRGIAKGEINDYDGAIADFTAALQLEPNNVGAWFHRGNMKFEKNMLDDAIEDYRMALRYNPERSDVWFASADAFLEKDDPQKAIEHYTEGLRLKPKHPVAYTNRALAKITAGDLEGAIQDCKSALMIRPTLSEAKEVMAKAKLQQEKKAEWRIEALPPYTVAPYLEPYGFVANNESTWRSLPDTDGPEVKFLVQGHVQEDGHTWYIIGCELKCSRVLEEPLCWTVRRRLVQLREDLHGPLKAELGDDKYATIFIGAPFALKGGMPGTTARLTDWFSAYGRCINAGGVSPAMVARTLQFLNISMPPASRDDEGGDVESELNIGEQASEDTSPQIKWKPRLMHQRGIAERQLMPKEAVNSIESKPQGGYMSPCPDKVPV